MAKRELNSKVIYQVFVRDFPKDGTLSSVLKKIDYFKKLGVDTRLFKIAQEMLKGKKR